MKDRLFLCLAICLYTIPTFATPVGQPFRVSVEACDYDETSTSQTMKNTDKEADSACGADDYNWSARISKYDLSYGVTWSCMTVIAEATYQCHSEW